MSISMRGAPRRREKWHEMTVTLSGPGGRQKRAGHRGNKLRFYKRPPPDRGWISRPARGEGLSRQGQGETECTASCGDWRVPYETEMNIKRSGEGPMAATDGPKGGHWHCIDLRRCSQRTRCTSPTRCSCLRPITTDPKKERRRATGRQRPAARRCRSVPLSTKRQGFLTQCPTLAPTMERALSIRTGATAATFASAQFGRGGRPAAAFRAGRIRRSTLRRGFQFCPSRVSQEQKWLTARLNVDWQRADANLSIRKWSSRGGPSAWTLNKSPSRCSSV